MGVHWWQWQQEEDSGAETYKRNFIIVIVLMNIGSSVLCAADMCITIICNYTCTQCAILTAASVGGKSNGDMRARMADNIMNSLMATARRGEEGSIIKLKEQVTLTF